MINKVLFTDNKLNSIANRSTNIAFAGNNTNKNDSFQKSVNSSVDFTNSPIAEKCLYNYPKHLVSFGQFGDDVYIETEYERCNRKIKEEDQGYFNSIEQGQLDFNGLKSLVSKTFAPDVRDESGRTLLHALAGVDIQGADTLIKLALEKRVGYKDRTDCIRFVEKKLDINTQDNYGNTALLESVISENVLIAAALLKNKADSNIQNIAGDTAMHYACKSGDIGMIKLLVNSNAKLDTKNLAGKTAMDYAKEKGRDVLNALSKPGTFSSLKQGTIII